MNSDEHRFEGMLAVGRAMGIASLAVLAVLPARGGEPQPPPPITPAARLETARAEIALTRSNIVLTLEQLDDVRRADDPQAQFQRFVAQLEKMKERAKLIRERAQLMQSRGYAYFAAWETRADGNTEAVQAKRKAAYDLIIQQMQLAGTNFFPLVAELEQIKALLEGERSKEKVAAAKDLFMQANWHCVNVQRALMRTEDELNSLAADFAGKEPAR